MFACYGIMSLCVGGGGVAATKLHTTVLDLGEELRVPTIHNIKTWGTPQASHMTLRGYLIFIYIFHKRYSIKSNLK